MIEGKTYRVDYIQHHANYRKTPMLMVAVYLGRDEPKREEQFSLRPLAGTTAVRVEDITKVAEVPDSTPPALPRREGMLP